MWMNPARLATALSAAALLAGTATPASAALFGIGRKAEEPAKAAPEATSGQRLATPAERQMAARLDPLAQVAFWSREMQVDPTDAEAGVNLAAGLRTLGRYDEASVIAQQVLVTHPNNVEALLEDARAKIGGGKPFYAIQPLIQAKAAAPADWRPATLLGVAYEQTQQPDQAQAAFLAALQISPDSPAALTNYALFLAGRGQKDQAETLMRRAVANPSAGARERQNLALILGLQGKIGEAERLLRQDLPPEIAEANLAYLRNASAPGGPAAASASRNWEAMGAQSAQ